MEGWRRCRVTIMEDLAVRLTAFAAGGGCATKIAQADLAGMLGSLGLPSDDPDLLIGSDTGDDAAVYRLRSDLALVMTTDFFAPVVDDPEDYGAIAATNALSDVYAMGGEPRVALNLVAWPAPEILPFSILETVLRAGAEVVRTAGAVVAGGHSVRDQEPKFGLAVVGTVHPDRVMSNAAGRPGDVLILTKPLGTGIVSNATKLSEAPPEVVAAAIATMRTLNRDAATAALDAGVRCCTDVTGFGLLGHARNISMGSRCAIEIDARDLPLLPGVEELVAAGLIPGGSRRNLAFADTWTEWIGADELTRVMVTDAQTSGGLLICCPEAASAELRASIEGVGGLAAVVGRLREGAAGAMTVIG